MLKTILKKAIQVIDTLPIPLYRLMLFICTLSICYLAFSKGGVNVEIHHGDKISHLSAFFVLTWLLRHAMQVKVWQQIVILMSFGLFIELVQSNLPSRSASYLDLLADLLGVLLFLLFEWCYQGYLKPKLIK